MKGIAYFDKNCSTNEAKISGNIYLNQHNSHSKVIIKIDLKGFRPKTEHAMHIHEYGNISKGCMSSGGHFNSFSSKSW